ncbi:MAG: hypothetical protein NTU47_13430 [Ignavibacteriales bacterium]|nr:hypothetical protein [Ignavibacteriales bacterium]
MLTALLFPFLLLSAQLDAIARQQYLVVNIIPGEQYEEVFQQVRKLQNPKSTAGVRLGIGAIFSYLNESRDQCRSRVLGFLSLAEQYDIPIIVQLDGEQWWDARPDLWNWWDRGRDGYNPGNRMNVEWTGWDSAYAMKIAWRNWGKQIRVLPPPNLMSPPYRQACHDEMRVLVPLVLEWWKHLPDDRKSLLLGIKIGWESSIGVNAFYLPNGNDLLDRPESADPQVELKGDQVPGRGVIASGYAAVTTAGLAKSGPLQEKDVAEIVRRHLDDLCALASGLGVPRQKLFTHVGGWKEEELLYDAALNRYSCPGWSFYRHAGDALKDRGVQRVLRKSDAPFWGAVEWMLMGTEGEQAWHEAITRTLSIPKCRYLCIYNWSGIRDNRGAVAAIEAVLSDGARR